MLINKKCWVHLADKTSVVSAAKKAATSAFSMESTTLRGRLWCPGGVVNEIDMSDVSAFLAADATDVLASDTTDLMSAAKTSSGSFGLAQNNVFRVSVFSPWKWTDPKKRTCRSNNVGQDFLHALLIVVKKYDPAFSW